MSERMEVEVDDVCRRCRGQRSGGIGPACRACGDKGWAVVKMVAAEGTRTEALLRLAEAAQCWREEHGWVLYDPGDSFYAALAAVRAFDQGEGKDG